jgi:pimeloyl-ACP methyl ester carboxylesterase
MELKKGGGPGAFTKEKEMNRSAIILTAALAFVSVAQAQFESPGVEDRLPVFYEKLASRMNYPLSWLSGGHDNYAAWRTRGQSAFTMLHPGLGNQLDYPDVASIACPKPMMFVCGRRDGLFPVATIEDAFAKMRRVWESQKAGAQLDTRLYDAPHEFNATMQDDAFTWLDRQFQPKR